MSIYRWPIAIIFVMIEFKLLTALPEYVAFDDIRVIGGSGDHEGRVEVLYKGIWGAICDTNWGLKDGLVACRHLGFKGVEEAYRGSFFGPGNHSTRLDEFDCRGSEWQLHKCQFHLSTCSNQSEAGVKCHTSLELRLVGGSGGHEGRVEVLHDGEWGTICDTNWGKKDAEVVCRYLGYSGVAESFRKSFFGPGSGLLWLDKVNCQGNELAITKCEHSPWYYKSPSCSNFTEAGVNCTMGDYLVESTTEVMNMETVPYSTKDEMTSKQTATEGRSSSISVSCEIYFPYLIGVFIFLMI